MSEEPEKPPETNGEPGEVLYDLTSTQDAAKLLRVSESTVWRWIDQDILPAYRVGRKRVWLRRSDLESLVNPLRRRKKKTVRENTEIQTFPMADSGPGASNVVSRARALQAAVLARRGGTPLPDAWQDINDAREQRSADL